MNHFQTRDFTNLLGFLYLSISCVLYGTYIIPTKHYDIGDGIYYQFNLASGFFLFSFVFYILQGMPKFFLIPAIGGIFWTCGNLFTGTIIKCLGIGFGTLWSNNICLVVGWASARFGW